MCSSVLKCVPVYIRWSQSTVVDFGSVLTYLTLPYCLHGKSKGNRALGRHRSGVILYKKVLFHLVLPKRRNFCEFFA
jgi:hypothetical protein